MFVYGSTDAKWKVYTAKNLGNFDITPSTTIQYILDSNKIVAMAVMTGSFPTGGSNTTSYGYVTNRVDTKDSGDDSIVQLTVWDGTNEVTVNVDGSSCNAYIGDFVEFPVVADNAKVNNSDVKVEVAASGAGSTGFQIVKIKTVESNRIITTTDTVAANGQVVDGQDTAWTLTSSTKKIGVNTADNEKSDNNSIIAYTKTAGEDYANAAIFYEVKSGYNEIKAIFIDSDNKLIPYQNGNEQGATGIASIYTVATPGTITDAQGLKATVKADKTRVIAGNSITYTVTVTGTASAAAKITFTVGANSTASALTVSGEGWTKEGNTVAKVEKDKGAGTIQFTVTAGSGDVGAPTIAIAAQA